MRIPEGIGPAVRIRNPMVGGAILTLPRPPPHDLRFGYVLSSARDHFSPREIQPSETAELNRLGAAQDGRLKTPQAILSCNADSLVNLSYSND